jgi:predicted nucleic acid-binding protein
MKAKGTKRVDPLVAFWDTSAVVPLCVFQPQSSQARKAARVYGKQIVWWATPVEAVSSLHRLVREESLTMEELGQALVRLNHLRRLWSEIQPDEDLRETAERLLGVHKLRASDAFQLAAALVWTNNLTRSRHFVGADGALLLAAKAEGFSVVDISGK